MDNRHWSRHASRDIPKAQYAFKYLLVHGILQFTMLIALRCALHRYSSRDIRRWKLFIKKRHLTAIIKNGLDSKSDTSIWQLTNADYPRTLAKGKSAQSLHPKASIHNVLFTVVWFISCEWSFRRFTYGNLVTTSPSSKWWGSLNFPLQRSGTEQCCSPNYSPNHSIGRSDGRCVQRAGT